MNPFDTFKGMVRWLLLERPGDWVPALLALLYLWVLLRLA